MIDLHTHTVFSDGELIPAELARRAKVAGYRAIAMTDHADGSNIDHILVNQKKICTEYGHFAGIDIFCGVELTHVPPALIPDLIVHARKNGADLVVVHGETIVEPVERGTNLAAIEGGADILAHPGLITVQEVQLAAEKGVALEITTRKGHSLTNGRLVAMARNYKARLVINNDAHAPGDLVCADLRAGVGLGAGLTNAELEEVENNSRAVVGAMIDGRKDNLPLLNSRCK